MIIEKLEAYKPPNSTYQSFEIEYKLASPLIMAYPWIHADGLLARQLMIELLGDEFYNLPAKSPIPIWKHLKLPLAFSHRVYHASASVLDSSDMHATTFYKRFHEAADLKTTAKVRRGSGQLRDYMMKEPYSASRSVKFYFHGDIEEVSRLMRPIRHLGKKHAAGGGQVASVEVRETPEDWSLIKDGMIMRNIPSRELKEFNLGHIMNAAYCFPYWAGENVALCVVPGSQGSL